MYQNKFVPVTLVLRLSLPEDTNLDRWCDITAFILEAYAKALTKEEGVYIGHIKALFEGAGSDYIKLSIFKEDIPVGTEVLGSNKYKEINLLVNSIVYGVDEEVSVNALRKVFEDYRNLLIDYEIEILHHHHEHH